MRSQVAIAPHEVNSPAIAQLRQEISQLRTETQQMRATNQVKELRPTSTEVLRQKKPKTAQESIRVPPPIKVDRLFGSFKNTKQEAEQPAAHVPIYCLSQRYDQGSVRAPPKLLTSSTLQETFQHGTSAVSRLAQKIQEPLRPVNRSLSQITMGVDGLSMIKRIKNSWTEAPKSPEKASKPIYLAAKEKQEQRSGYEESFAGRMEALQKQIASASSRSSEQNRRTRADLQMRRAAIFKRLEEIVVLRKENKFTTELKQENSALIKESDALQERLQHLAAVERDVELIRGIRFRTDGLAPELGQTMRELNARIALYVAFVHTGKEMDYADIIAFDPKSVQIPADVGTRLGQIRYSGILHERSQKHAQTLQTLLASQKNATEATLTQRLLDVELCFAEAADRAQTAEQLRELGQKMQIIWKNAKLQTDRKIEQTRVSEQL